MNFTHYIITNGQAVPENPWSMRRAIELNSLALRRKFTEFYNWAKSHTLPFIGDLPDGSRVKREDMIVEAWFFSYWAEITFDQIDFFISKGDGIRVKLRDTPNNSHPLKW